MVVTSENILLIGSILLFFSMLGGKTSSRFGVPVLLIFIAIGMLAGSEGIGGISFDKPKVAQFIGIIALNFILFSGGLDTDWHSVKPLIKQGVTLSTVGVLITAVSVGVFVWAVTDFTIYEGLLLGSIVSSTDSAAVFSILRSKSLALKNNIRPLLELESGSNDPTAYVLTLVFTEIVATQSADWAHAILFLFTQLILGGALGYVFGKASKWIINHIQLDHEGLYVVLGIVIMFFSFSATNFVGGNGFLAIYICAVYLGSQKLIHKKQLIKSFDSFAWLMQIVLFLTLGLLIFPSRILPVVGIGLIVALFLMFVARPLAVFISLSFFKMQNRSRTFISWVGLRGAVPIVFATYPLIAHVHMADMIFNMVFFISVTSVLIQGTTLTAVAKWLHLSLPEKAKQRSLTDLELEDSIKSNLISIVIAETAVAANKKIVDLNLPQKALISIIQRNKNYITPNGSTVLKAGDTLFVISEDEKTMHNVLEILEVDKLTVVKT